MISTTLYEGIEINIMKGKGEQYGSSGSNKRIN